MRYQVTKGDGVPGEERHAHAPGSTQQQQHPMEAKNVPECRMMEKESDREMNRMDKPSVAHTLLYPSLADRQFTIVFNCLRTHAQKKLRGS